MHASPAACHHPRQGHVASCREVSSSGGVAWRGAQLGSIRPSSRGCDMRWKSSATCRPACSPGAVGRWWCGPHTWHTVLATRVDCLRYIFLRFVRLRSTRPTRPQSAQCRLRGRCCLPARIKAAAHSVVLQVDYALGTAEPAETLTCKSSPVCYGNSVMHSESHVYCKAFPCNDTGCIMACMPNKASGPQFFNFTNTSTITTFIISDQCHCSITMSLRVRYKLFLAVKIQNHSLDCLYGLAE